MANAWDDKKKTEVVVCYLALGKLPMVEAVTGVPRATIQQWKTQPWWLELVSNIQEENTQELDTKLSKIIDKSLDGVNERIENGEFILDSKSGTVKRIPVKLKDVLRVASDLLDKRDLIRGRPASRQKDEVQTEVLRKLAHTFAQWVQVNLKPEPRTIEGVVVDAVYEERNPRLQDGIQQVPQPSEANTQSG